MTISTYPGLQNTQALSYGQSTNPLASFQQMMQQGISSLQTTDPSLAKQLQSLQTQLQQASANGTSPRSILKNFMNGLTSSQKSEVQSAFGLSGTNGASGFATSLDPAAAFQNALTQGISKLQTTDPALANQLQAVQQQMQASSSTTDPMATFKNFMSGLSSSQKAEVSNALGIHGHRHGMHAPSGSGAANSLMSIVGAPSAAGDSDGDNDGSGAAAGGTSALTASSNASNLNIASLLNSSSQVQNSSVWNYISQQSDPFATAA